MVTSVSLCFRRARNAMPPSRTIIWAHSTAPMLTFRYTKIVRSKHGFSRVNFETLNRFRQLEARFRAGPRCDAWSIEGLKYCAEESQ